MEIREGGNVILQFILEEHLLLYPSDSYQLPREREQHGEGKRQGEKDKLKKDQKCRQRRVKERTGSVKPSKREDQSLGEVHFTSSQVTAEAALHQDRKYRTELRSILFIGNDHPCQHCQDCYRTKNTKDVRCWCWSLKPYDSSHPVSILFNPDIYSAVKQMVDGSWIDKKKKWEISATFSENITASQVQTTGR